MKHLIVGMQKEILELIDWQNLNQDAPESVKTAVRNHRAELVKAIESMQEAPFEIGDRVELCSSSYEDSGRFNGDLGRVEDIKHTTDAVGIKSYDIRVRWDSGDESWLDADDFTDYDG